MINMWNADNDNDYNNWASKIHFKHLMLMCISSVHVSNENMFHSMIYLNDAAIQSLLSGLYWLQQRVLGYATSADLSKQYSNRP